ncbi:MAG: molybdenum cofactor guanylyltransferase [Actinobacteria bacterium]|nr:molybdenum cofactor guanylyltransferase [Actinomycetota bacterium]
MSEHFDAIVLAGGRGDRLGGTDKAVVTLGGTTFLDRVLAVTAGAGRIVCVGPERTTSVPVTWTRERPAGGGPVAALAAGLLHVDAPIAVVLAVDAVFMTGEVLDRLVGACNGDAAVLVDANGHRQPLMAAYRTRFLRDRIDRFARVENLAMKDVLEGADVTTVEDPDAARDVDTWADLDAARAEVSS